MARRKFYDMDRATIVRMSSGLNGLNAGYRRGHKNERWSAGQQEDLYFLTEKIMELLSVVNHLSEIVQNDGE